jgi:hypothetical protein
VNSYNGFEPAERMRALRWLKGEVAAGRRHQPTVCEACGQTEGIVEAHSEDYSAPFGDHIGAYGFCYVCHMMIHCRFKAPDAWVSYISALRDGHRPLPSYSRAFGVIRGLLAGRYTLWSNTPNAPRERTVLDDIDEGTRRGNKHGQEGTD